MSATFEFAVGTRVRHVTRGTGVVTEHMPDGRTRVHFDDGSYDVDALSRWGLS